MTLAFTGHIAGIGTTSGTRLVIGAWDESPFGAFTDVMVERPSGHRILIAPHPDVAEFVATTYAFDETRVEPVETDSGNRWSVRTTSLEATFTPGDRLAVARLLALVPGPLRASSGWARLISPIAGRVMPGVRTYGTAGHHRTEWYAARDVRHITSVTAILDKVDLGPLAPVSPPVRFGFASAPTTPTLTSLTSYVRDERG